MRPTKVLLRITTKMTRSAHLQNLKICPGGPSIMEGHWDHQAQKKTMPFKHRISCPSSGPKQTVPLRLASAWRLSKATLQAKPAPVPSPSVRGPPQKLRLPRRQLGSSAGPGALTTSLITVKGRTSGTQKKPIDQEIMLIGPSRRLAAAQGSRTPKPAARCAGPTQSSLSAQQTKKSHLYQLQQAGQPGRYLQRRCYTTSPGSATVALTCPAGKYDEVLVVETAKIRDLAALCIHPLKPKRARNGGIIIEIATALLKAVGTLPGEVIIGVLSWGSDALDLTWVRCLLAANKSAAAGNRLPVL
ncbi:hypothetical protein KM043_014448 [Ampulex compressa]|nr:hypothetical protein KM043_014448 [Ampulex compressa]